MNFRKLLLASAATAAASASFVTPTQASIIDRPHFKVEPIIIVWASTDANAGDAIVSDFIVGSASTDLISSDGVAVETGSMIPTDDAHSNAALNTLFDLTGSGITDQTDFDVLDPAASLDPFDPAAATFTNGSGSPTWQSSFYVASNTAFTIEATAVLVGSSDFALSDIGYDLGVNGGTATDGLITWGSASQDPTGAGGIGTTGSNLGALASSPTVFIAGQKTAASSGSIPDQSARFDAVYTLFPGTGDGYDLSKGSGEIQATVTYTFYTA